MSLKKFLGLLCLILVPAIIKAKYNEKEDTSWLNAIETDRIVVCLLIYFYRWNYIYSLNFITTDDPGLNSDIKSKVKALMLDKCFKEMPEEVVIEVILY